MEDWRPKRETDFVVNGLLPQRIMTECALLLHSHAQILISVRAWTLGERCLRWIVMERRRHEKVDRSGAETVDGFMGGISADGCSRKSMGALIKWAAGQKCLL